MEGIMSKQDFIRSIISVAEQLKGSPITELEEEKIVKLFNSYNTGTAYERAKRSIEEVIGKKIYIENLIIEKAAPLDNLKRLLAQMNVAANNWQNNKK